jgi:hypothetical protein
MGVTRFDQISRYTLHSAGNEDELKIYYRRPDDSTLPKSKKFQFPRLGNGPDASTSTNGSATDSALLQAVTELNALTSNGNGKGSAQARQLLASELEQLEQVMMAKVGELRRRLADWR